MLWNLMKKYMNEYPDSVISDSVTRITFYETIKFAEKLGTLIASTTPPKSKCAILCNKGVNTAIALLACWSADMVPIPITMNYGTLNNKKIIEVTNPNIFITDNDKNELLDSIKMGKCNYIKDIFYGKTNNCKIDEILSDVSLIMCTSGTTGSPKGVMIKGSGIITNLLDIKAYFTINSKDKILIARPLYHCAVLTGELLISLVKGLNIFFVDDIYNPTGILHNVKKNNITVLCGTPTLFYHLSMYINRLDIEHNLRIIALSGECLSENIAKIIRQAFSKTDIYNIYGLTEASPRVSYLKPELFDKFPESVGIPLYSVTLKVIDNSDQEVKSNVKGNLLVKAPSIMKGYYNNKNKTESVIKDGWLYTGDIAYINEDGLLFINSRADDMIIKAGMNIYPKEIENELMKSGAIKEVIAYKIANKIGQDIALDIVMEDDFKGISIKEIMGICSKLLPAYQLPIMINIVDELKRNASGKIIRPKGDIYAGK